MTVSTHIICNGCGLYTSPDKVNQDKFRDQKLNKITVDLTHYLLFSAGATLKEPQVEIHLCNNCYSNFLTSEIKTRDFGSIEKIRLDIVKLRKDKAKVEDDFKKYKLKINELLEGKVNG